MDKRRVYLYPQYPSGVGAQIYEGIYRFANEQRWNLVQLNADLYKQAAQRNGLRRVGGGGLLVCPSTREELVDAAQMRLPCVAISDRQQERFLPQVGLDHRACGRVVAEHLRQLGIKSLGFLHSFLSLGTSRCWSGFRQYARSAGMSVSRFSAAGRYPFRKVSLTRTLPNEQEMCNWLASLPKPCGIYSSTCIGGIWIHQCCQTLSLSIPETVSLIVQKDDPVFCQSTHPPLSALRVDYVGLGYQSAQTLSSLCDRRPVKKLSLFVPEGVIARQSTDVLHTTIPGVADAIAYIRAEACRGASASQAARLAGYCRRNLDRHFQEVIGHTVFEEIQRVRIARAQELLRNPSLTLDTVAEQSGFCSASHLSRTFSAAVGLTPGAWRNGSYSNDL